MTNDELTQAVQDGLKLAQSGRLEESFRLLMAAKESGLQDADGLITLAAVCRRLEKHQDCLDAADAALQVQPLRIESNLLKADALKALGRRRTASSFYSAALRLAGNQGNLPPQIVAELQRAQQECVSAEADFKDILVASVEKHAAIDGAAGRRIRHAIDFMLGERDVYFQNPNKLFLPELPHRQFFERDEFDWIEELEAKTAVIRDELVGILDADPDFTPYVQHNADAPAIDDVNLKLIDDQNWTAYFLVKDSKPLPAHIERAPETYRAVQSSPLPDIEGVSPAILFSRLLPGGHIVPHHGMTNARLLCHLPLIVPPGCWFRVGNETREWREGEAIIFDDTIEHEARNSGTETRIVLIFDIWRPGLHEEERALVRTVFETIEST